ncbi:hypothetical protein BIV60_09040 [Bacillus sp. MUM 116]|nr:hypothetical protein BIV60_09040 [Bacillus sp. MUM 116]
MFIILGYELNPLENEANNLKKQIEKLEKEMLNVIDLSSDETLNLDAEMLKSHLASKQEAINKKKSPDYSQ